VLCVEDDLVTLELVKAMLAPREDLRLISAINGREGVALALAYEPAVILMDNQMPEMSGQQAMQLLAQDPRTSGIPIIAMSASPSAPALEGAANNGERWFRRVAKPFDREQLLSAIDEAVRRS
jgi:CheY-like chemotaxis protein